MHNLTEHEMWTPSVREPLSGDRERLKAKIREKERQIAKLAHEKWLLELELGSD